MMKALTKAEEQVMMAVWSSGGGLLMDIVHGMPDPQPHKNTVATILKILVEKNFVNIQPVGRFHKYLPAISKESYSSRSLSSLAEGYFDGSYKNVVSFLVDDDKLSVKDLELLLKQLKSK